MDLLKIINPEHVDIDKVNHWKQRKAARAVVYDEHNKIGILHVKSSNYYKLPGGGIEYGESILDTVERECTEELGVKIEILQEIGYIVEYRAQFQLIQTSYCYSAQILSNKDYPNFTEEEKSQGFEILWVPPREALMKLSLNLSTDYEAKYIEERDFCFLSNALKGAKTSQS